MTRDSFSEMDARERAAALLDPGTFRELLGPWQRFESPHLERQGIVPQSDDGVVVARGALAAVSAVVISIEGNFQGGSIGEVGGAKIAGALELALRDASIGRPVRPVLILDTGGIRVQEANLGLLAVSEIHAAILALRMRSNVVGIIAGKIGCFGGMAIAAGLCTTLIGTEVGRLGLNGPEVIEQEAGMEELDSSDQPGIWEIFGCRARKSQGQIDMLVPDSAADIASAVRSAFVHNDTFRSRTTLTKFQNDEFV
ncbi:MAG: Malonate decarboxylase beta subunit [Acidobacteriaceae bacterium]|jgi:malonate decarboxylase beta subunit|nr:Malonate decarboxylase beta subunit [Acidobacteriaceae bacterium]